MRNRQVPGRLGKAARRRWRKWIGVFAVSEGGAASSEFVVVLVTAVALSLLVTAKVGVATGAIVVSTGSEMTALERVGDPAPVEGCAVEVNGARGGGALIKGC